ncbi:MAG: tol-pal system protein YbgF [Candidatus Rokuibacteriota bacterium]
MTRALGAVAVVLVVASGCASRGSVRRLQADLTALRTEVLALRQAYEEQARQAEAALADVRALEARVKELSVASTEAAESVRRLGGGVATVEQGLKNVRTEMVGRPPATPPPPEPRPREAPPAPPDGAEAMYQGALATFRIREYGQAVLEFLDFLAGHPKHPLAANAQYWIGEAYFIQRDWRQAIVEFGKVVENHGRNGKAADALLRIGYCYANLRELPLARLAWQRVLDQHPGSEAAERARGLLQPGRPASR